MGNLGVGLTAATTGAQGSLADESIDGALALPRPLLLDALVERHLTHDAVQPLSGAVIQDTVNLS